MLMQHVGSGPYCPLAKLFSLVCGKQSSNPRRTSEWTGWVSLQFKGLSRVFSNTTVQKHQFFGAHIGVSASASVLPMNTQH